MLGSLYSATAAFSTSAMGCAVYAALAALRQSYDVYSVGMELPTSQFVQASVQTDP
jgi:hypothetical protein